MPFSRDGLTPLISFAIERGADAHFEGTTSVRVTKGHRTIAHIAADRGHRELAPKIAKMNKVRSIYTKLKIGRTLKVPDKLSSKFFFHVKAGDTAPIITDGYAQIDTIDRADRTGLSVFTGYHPIVMSIPVRFEGYDDNNRGVFQNANGQYVERDIKELERMVGRGVHHGAARGPAAIVRVSTTDSTSRGNPIPLIPLNYQWTPSNPYSKLWWISGIEWDPDPIRNPQSGNRVRQLATIELTEYVRPVAATSVVVRKKTRGKGKGK